MRYKKPLAVVLALGIIAGLPAIVPHISAPVLTSCAEETVIIDLGTLTLSNEKPSMRAVFSGVDVTSLDWSSSDNSVAVVSPTGTITATGSGTCTVQGSDGSKAYQVTVVSEYTPPEIDNGELKTISLGTLSLDNEKPSAKASLVGSGIEVLRWTTSDPAVAVVDENGEITAMGKGECVVYAFTQSTQYEIAVTSDYDVEEAGTADIVMPDLKFTNDITARQIVFDAPDGTEIIYSSSDEDIAKVSASGLVTAQGFGKCQIYAEIGSTRYIFNVSSAYTGMPSGAVLIGEISLTEESPSQTITLTVSAGSEISWSSSDSSVAVVSPTGTVTAVGQGQCTVYAETSGATYAITVNVEFNPEENLQVFTINGKGSTLTLSFPDMDGNTVFSSSNPAVAVIDSGGTVTAVSEGETIIKAVSSKGTAMVKIIVTDTRGLGLVGDANCDGKVTIADAAAIIQSLGNPDKYSLSEQGSKNADVDGVAGVTVSDALMIQKLEAGMIDSL